MQVILLKTVPGLGQAGDTKSVAEGYARNFLIPRGLAEPATDSALRRAGQMRETAQRGKARKHDELHELARKLDHLTIQFSEAVSESGKLYAALTEQKIAEALKRRGLDIEYKQVKIEKPIKKPGTYDVRVALGHGLEALIHCTVNTAA